MTEDIFQQTLKEFKHRKPFQPFIIELESGEQIEIDDPDALAFAGGAGGFLTPTLDLVRFSCDDVRDVRATAETKS